MFYFVYLRSLKQPAIFVVAYNDCKVICIFTTSKIFNEVSKCVNVENPKLFHKYHAFYLFFSIDLKINFLNVF